MRKHLKPRPHQQQCRSNVRLCRSNVRLCWKNRLTCCIRQCCFDIVAGVDGALAASSVSNGRMWRSACVWYVYSCGWRPTQYIHDFCICHHRSRLMLQVSHLQCQCLAPPATIYTFWPADVRWWINHHHTYSCTTNMLFLLVPLSVAVACCTGRRRLWLTKCSGFLIPLHVLSRTLGIMIDLHHAMIHDLHWPGHDRPHSVPDCSHRVSCLHDHAPDYVSELCACPASYTSSSYS